MYLDEKNHVVWDGVTEYTEADKMIEFLINFQNTDKSLIKPFIFGKLRYYENIVALNEKGISGWMFNGRPSPLDPKDAERNKESLLGWREAARIM